MSMDSNVGVFFNKGILGLVIFYNAVESWCLESETCKQMKQ